MKMICICAVGKTYQAIAVADFYRDDWPLLIVTTATARETWERHIKDLLPSVPSESIRSIVSSTDYIGDCKVLITSYPLMDRNADRLVEKQFGFVILVNSKHKSTSRFVSVYQFANHFSLSAFLG